MSPRPDYQSGNVPGFPGKAALVALDVAINGSQGGFVTAMATGTMNCVPADNTDQATGISVVVSLAGQAAPFRVSKVLSSGTNISATNLVASF